MSSSSCYPGRLSVVLNQAGMGESWTAGGAGFRNLHVEAITRGSPPRSEIIGDLP
jgi:hypothetical protein